MYPDTKRKRREDVRTRAAREDTMYSYCRVIGCGKPTTAGAGKGLDRLYCRKHADHFERHGSYTKGSYTAPQLAPHRKTARAWMSGHESEPRVQLAIRAIASLYRRAGPHVEAFRLRGLPPKDRARAAWARLREAGVNPQEPLVAWLAVELALHADPKAERKSEYKRVQAGKLIRRMAGGAHKRWERQRYDGRIVVEELHKYPQSRGRVLRHLGEQLEKAAELLVDACVAECFNSSRAPLQVVPDDVIVLPFP